MSFVLIRGEYHVKGYSPDGDSIKFKAFDDDNWKKLTGNSVRLNGNRHAQLRLEGIDTLETHFREVHQPLDLATAALSFLLDTLGIPREIWSSDLAKLVDTNDGVQGYILARTVEKNHRPVAYAFAGTPPEPDGIRLHLDVARLQESANYKLLLKGLAYPTYYKGSFSDLREALTQAVQTARQASRGLWPRDCTTQGVEVQSLQSITEQQVILPKLFRRLVEFLENGGAIEHFKEFMTARNEGVWIIPTALLTHFDTVIEVNHQTIKMTVPPEQLIFES